MCPFFVQNPVGTHCLQPVGNSERAAAVPRTGTKPPLGDLELIVTTPRIHKRQRASSGKSPLEIEVVTHTETQRSVRHLPFFSCGEEG
jgi:hypothetical protein